MRDQLTELGFAAGWRLVRALPLPVARALFNAAADRGFKGNGPGTQRLRRNLRQVVGPAMSDAELDELVRAGLRSYARYWMEAFRLPSLKPRDHLTNFDLINGHLLHEDRKAGRGSVVALPHAGNWDAAAAWVVANGLQLVTVAERLKPEGVFRQFIAYREKLGMEVLPLTGGQRSPIDVLCEKAQAGYTIALLAERDLSARGVEVDFFGGRTRMPPGPALVALRTGASLYASDMWFSGKQALGMLHPIRPATEGSLADRARATTQLLANQFEKGIAEHPQDWHMLQKMWLNPRKQG